MWDCFENFSWKKTGLFAAGVLFGTAGLKVLSGRDAKKVYANCTAAFLRAKDSVMKTATNIQENAGDILAEAKQINEDRETEVEYDDAFSFTAEEETDDAGLKEGMSQETFSEDGE